MACNCPGARRSARLTAKATRVATRKAKKGIPIKPAQPKRVAAKKVPAKKAKPCTCT